MGSCFTKEEEPQEYDKFESPLAAQAGPNTQRKTTHQQPNNPISAVPKDTQLDQREQQNSAGSVFYSPPVFVVTDNDEELQKEQRKESNSKQQSIPSSPNPTKVAPLIEITNTSSPNQTPNRNSLTPQSDNRRRSSANRKRGVSRPHVGPIEPGTPPPPAPQRRASRSNPNDNQVSSQRGTAESIGTPEVPQRRVSRAVGDHSVSTQRRVSKAVNNNVDSNDQNRARKISTASPARRRTTVSKPKQLTTNQEDVDEELNRIEAELINEDELDNIDSELQQLEEEEAIEAELKALEQEEMEEDELEEEELEIEEGLQELEDSDSMDIETMEKQTEVIPGETAIQRKDRIAKNFRKRAKALWDFKGDASNDELSFKAGDIISVIETDDEGWWKGELNDEEGWFPVNYVEIMKREVKLTQDIDPKIRLLQQSLKI